MSEKNKPLNQSKVVILTEGLTVLLQDLMERSEISDADSLRQLKVWTQCASKTRLTEDGLFGDLTHQ